MCMLRVVNRDLRPVSLHNALDLHMEYPGWNEKTAHGDSVVRTNTPLPLQPSDIGKAGVGVAYPEDRWLLDTPADNLLWLQGGQHTWLPGRWLERRKRCISRRGEDSAE